MSEAHLETWLGMVEAACVAGECIQVALNNYKGEEKDLKKIILRPVVIKDAPHVSLTIRFKTRDVTKNHAQEDVVHVLQTLFDDGFRQGVLYTPQNDVLLDVFPNGRMLLKKMKATQKQVVNITHDREKTRLIKGDAAPYLQSLGITDKAGVVFPKAQDKYKQINAYIGLLEAPLRELGADKAVSVVDMGSGKGYLTFALYDYLQRVMGVEAMVTGVEFRPDMVALCNDMARKHQLDRLQFVEGTIRDYKTQAMDVLIALHACDTATDEAIFQGITSNAGLIVCAPCCHKQIRREMERSAKTNDVSFLTRHGIFMERQAEMVTDGIRALILEHFGYKVKVFEFISDAHTPKNVMIIGTKTEGDAPLDRLSAIADAKAYFGIHRHHLEDLMGL